MTSAYSADHALMPSAYSSTAIKSLAEQGLGRERLALFRVVDARPSGSTTAAASARGEPRLFDVEDGEVQEEQEHPCLQDYDNVQLDDCHGSGGGLENTKVLWAKALWFATQEARRRRAQGIADQKIARDASNTGVRLRSTVSMMQWMTAASVKRLNPNAVAALNIGTAPFAQSTPADLAEPPGHSSPSLGSATSSMTTISPTTTRRMILTRRASHLDSDGQDMSTEGARRNSIQGSRCTSIRLLTRMEKVALRMETLLHSPFYVYLTVACTFWVLGGDNVYVLLDPPMALDKPVYSLYVLCAWQFLIDLLLRSSWQAGYIFCFYFWLDVIALISLAPEVVYVLSDSVLFDFGAASLARTGRAASAGARVVRILRIVKLLKHLYELKKKNIHKDNNDLGDNSASELARKLEEYVTIHVIISVGAMLVLSTVLAIAYACNQDTQLDLALRVYARPLTACMGTQTESRDPSLYSLECIDKWKNDNLQEMVLRFRGSPYYQPLVYLEVSNTTLFGTADDYIRLYREKPKSYLILEFDDLGMGSGRGLVHLGNAEAVRDESRANLFTVSSVLLVIWILSITLTSSMRKEILGPMERIVKIIENLIHDPLGAQRLSKDRQTEETEELQKQKHSGSTMCWRLGPKPKKEEKNVYEVEKAILRVGKLLQLGLGEAGAKIISANMKDGNMQMDRSGELVHAIFGFCDIRNFTDCTEVLRADIVKLVNGIARHVHECTADNHGAANKNIGDAFLLVWKPKGDLGISTVAEASLRSYVRVILQMQMCKELRRWENKAAIQERMPGFQIRLGYGLHYGWAVEVKNKYVLISYMYAYPRFRGSCAVRRQLC